MRRIYEFYGYLNVEQDSLRVTRKPHRPRMGEVRLKLVFDVELPGDREYILNARVSVPAPEVLQMAAETDETSGVASGEDGA